MKSKVEIMSKILGLDLGDQWTGVALSDPSRILAKPYITIPTATLDQFLQELFQKESIHSVIVGCPKTMKGTASAQTQKVKIMFEHLQKVFSTMTFILWDERLSSKRAQMIHQGFSKSDKMKEHARAAAFILDSYLTFLHQQQET
ncbi:MAG: Holliday junction resolvase RuvX [Candidatus Babeliaceae bacterium]